MTITKYFLSLIFFLLYLPGIFASESLHLVTSLDPLEAQEYISAFEKDTGIDVEWIRLSAGEALARLKSERKNPSQDVWFGAPINEFMAAKRDGLLVPYRSPSTDKIPLKWKDKDYYYTGIYFGAIVFITRVGIDPPLSWNDLLKPEYKGEIVVSYPYTAGTGYEILVGLISIFGEERALEYYSKLNRQIRRYTKSGGSPIIEVGLGEANVGIVFDQDALRKGIARGFPLNITYPKDGVPYEIGCVAAIANGNKKPAGKFIDWIVSLRAQNIMQKWYRIPLNPSAEINKDSTPISSLNLVKMDFEKAGRERERIINKWRERVGK